MYFQAIGGAIDSIFNIVESASAHGYVTTLSSLVSISIVIIIMIKGYMVLAGKSQEPIRELAWDILVKMLIVTFALNIDGWCTAVIESMEALNSWAGGGVSLYAELDILYDKTRELAGMLYDKENMILGAICMVLVYIGFSIGVLPSLIIIITTSFTLKIIVLLAPLMFFALFYGWLKNMFTQWLSIFFSNTLTVLLMSLFFSAIITQFDSFITFSKNSSDSLDSLYIVSQVFITAILLNVLAYICYQIAEKIATVSLEGVGKSGFKQYMDNQKNNYKNAKNLFKKRS